MTVVSAQITLQTQGNGDTLDITDQVQSRVRESGLASGIVTVFSPSATSSLTTLEYESGCIADLQRLVEEILPADRTYAHNQRWGDGNGHSHIRAALFKPSLTIPFQEGRLTLGTWQQIVFLDFDTRPRSRSLVVQLLGE